MSLPASPDFPDHEPAGRGSPWMRGITAGRLALITAICVAFNLGNPDYEPFGPLQTFQSIVRNSATFFLASLPLFVLVIRAEMATVRLTPGRRIAILALAVLVGAILLALLRLGLRFGQLPIVGTPGGFWQNPVGHFFKALVVGGLLTCTLYFAVREQASQRLLLRTLVARAEIDKQMTEARLQLLQAQIEPHFLFNSLASVKLLYEKDPQKGRSLLRNLDDYLRVAISRARLREARLGEEVALARAFLAIFEVRMGARLRVRIDLPAELDSAIVPPLMLGTLVENAIKHGIGPRASGGTVSVVARRDETVLEVEVADDGVGFRVRSGRGVGLANIRARLQSLFGASGSLDLAGRHEGGVIATLRLPLRQTADPVAA